MQLAAAILAGGKASRLGGIAKGMLPNASGRAIVGHLIEQLVASGMAEIVISANDARPYTEFGRPIVADIHQEIGPLGGIEAVLHHLAPRADSVVLLPCDLPNVTAEEILGLLQVHRAMPERVVVARTAEGEHPLCAVVPLSVQPAVAAAIEGGKYGVGRLWRSLEAAYVQIDEPARLLNINTPDDLRQWRESPDRTGRE